MALSSVNCYTLLSDGSLKEGIPYALTDTGAGYVPVGTVNVRCVANKQTGALPRTRDELLFEASTFKQEWECSITSRNNWAGALLFVETKGLDFDPSASTDLGLENVYCGAETMERALQQVGDRRTGTQWQLLTIADKKSVFVSDRRSRYIEFTCDNGLLIGEPAQSRAVARFFADRALHRFHDRNSLSWTREVLGKLQCRHYWCKKLDRRYRLSGLPSKSGKQKHHDHTQQRA